MGIVSEGDLLRPFSKTHVTRRDWWLELIAEGEPLSTEFLAYVRQDNRLARDVMTKDVVTVTLWSDVGLIASTLVERNIKRVPVVEGSSVVGIVSRADLVRHMATRPDLIGSAAS